MWADMTIDMSHALACHHVAACALVMWYTYMHTWCMFNGQYLINSIVDLFIYLYSSYFLNVGLKLFAQVMWHI